MWLDENWCVQHDMAVEMVQMDYPRQELWMPTLIIVCVTRSHLLESWKSTLFLKAHLLEQKYSIILSFSFINRQFQVLWENYFIIPFCELFKIILKKKVIKSPFTKFWYTCLTPKNFSPSVKTLCPPLMSSIF